MKPSLGPPSPAASTSGEPLGTTAAGAAAGAAGAAAGGEAFTALGALAPRFQRTPLKAAVATMRPRQWVKNGLVIAAAGAAGALGRDDVPQRVLLACIAFCALSSGIYAINDVRDVAEDRLHPRKRFRPVAAGELSPRGATILGGGLVLGGLMTCLALSPLLGLVGGAYIALTLTYTLVWRHIVVMDILAVAGGFVLRALAGGVAADVRLSRWFVLVVSSAAVFVAGAKRLAELRRAHALPTPAGRLVLRGYTAELLLLSLGLSAGIALTAYCVWAFALPATGGVPWRPLTILPFAACLFRYLALVLAGDGEAPEELLLGDPLLLCGGLAWLVLFGLAVHAG